MVPVLLVQVVLGAPNGPGAYPLLHVAVQVDPTADPSHRLSGQLLLAGAVGSCTPVQPVAIRDVGEVHCNAQRQHNQSLFFAQSLWNNVV